MEHPQNDASAPLAMASVFISLALHAGAMTWFAFVNPKAQNHGGLFASEPPSLQLMLPPVDAQKPDPAPPTPPPTPEPLPPPEPAPKPPPPEVEEEPIRPGIDDSQAMTPNWLGFKEATPHSGVLSTVEQSAFSPNPGMPLPVGVRAPEGVPTPESAEREEARAQSVPSVSSPPMPEVVETVKPPVPPPEVPVTAPEEKVPTTAPQAAPVPPDSVPNPTAAPVKMEAEEKAAEATGDGIKKAPKVEAREGEPRPSPGPDRAPKETEPDLKPDLKPDSTPDATKDIKSEPVPKEAPEVVQEPGKDSRETSGIEAGKLEADGTQTREGEKSVEDKRAIEVVEAEQPRAERLMQAPMPVPTAPKAGEGPAPLPRVDPPAPDAVKAPQTIELVDALVGPMIPEAVAAERLKAGTQAPSGVDVSGSSPGEQADAESIAAALEEAVDVRPGKVLAARGLKIQTVRPEWSVTTRIMASPRNPVVKVTFGRSGKVIKAEFVEGQTTGWPEVDGPLKDALYRWTASGEQLNKLPMPPPVRADGSFPPQKGISLTFRVLLRTESPLEP